MMNHRQLHDALPALHDRELSAAEREEVLAHLKECMECRKEYQRWEHIARSIFRAPAAPTAGDTKVFVQQVMGRLGPDDSPAPSAVWGWLGARWMIPALGAGVAALFFSISQYSPESTAPLDALLLVDAHSRVVTELILPPDPSSTENVLDFAAEDG